MGRKGIIAAAVTVALISACGSGSEDSAAPPADAPGAAVAAAPAEQTYAVGRRELALARNKHRPLPTILLYPTVGEEGAPIRDGADPAPGKFPIVIYSHGLNGTPERYVPAAASWVSAGFVVALPAYPYTKIGATPYRRDDIKNQPADADYVIDRVRDLNTRAGDPLRGRIDGDNVGAVGHSAGGYTTNGMFTAGHDPRLKAGVVLAGWMGPGPFAGPPANMLFIHGDSDPVVPISDSRAAYEKVPWSKAYVLLPKNHHAQYMLPGNKGFPEVESLITDFLRWNLTGDQAARARYAAMVRNAPGDKGTMAG